jgi:inner membrane protein
MNRSAHGLAGALAASVGYVVTCKIAGHEPQGLKALVYTAAGWVAGCAPDILEPALHPHHRQIFHSLVFNGLLAAGVQTVMSRANLSVDQKAAATLGLAWLSHAVLDAATPLGLPLT